MLVKIFSIIALFVFIILMLNGAAMAFAGIRAIVTFLILIFSYQLFVFLTKAIAKNNDNKSTTSNDVTP